MSEPRGYLQPRNSQNVWVQGVVDDADPVNTDGTPKYIDTATVTWTLLDYTGDDAELALTQGSTLASGSGVAVGSGGAYLISIASTVALDTNNWLHVVIVAQTGFKADMVMRFDKKTRTGKTLQT
jgi:hypothetical protein